VHYFPHPHYCRLEEKNGERLDVYTHCAYIVRGTMSKISIALIFYFEVFNFGSFRAFCDGSFIVGVLPEPGNFSNYRSFCDGSLGERTFCNFLQRWVIWVILQHVTFVMVLL